MTRFTTGYFRTRSKINALRASKNIIKPRLYSIHSRIASVHTPAFQLYNSRERIYSFILLNFNAYSTTLMQHATSANATTTGNTTLTHVPTSDPPSPSKHNKTTKVHPQAVSDKLITSITQSSTTETHRDDPDGKFEEGKTIVKKCHQGRLRNQEFTPPNSLSVNSLTNE